MNPRTSDYRHALSHDALHNHSALNPNVGATDAHFLEDESRAREAVEDFLNGGDISSLHSATQRFRRILDYLADDHHSRRDIQRRLGMCYKLQYESTGDFDKLTEAISYHRASMHGLRGPHEIPMEHAIDLSGALHLRYSKLGDINDLQETISMLTPYHSIDSEWKSALLTQLAGCFLSRNEALGSKNDLDSSVSLLRAALHGTPTNHRLRDSVVNNLGAALGMRYLRGEGVNISDLHEAIEMQRESVRIRANGSNEYGRAVFNLAKSLGLLHSRVGGAGCLDEASQLMKNWINRKDNAEQNLRGSFLVTMAQMTMSKLGQQSRPEDFDSAILYLKEALTFHPSGHVRRSETLRELGQTLLGRFTLLRNSEDAFAGLECMQEALDILPPGHTRRSESYFELVRVYLARSAPFYSIHKAFDHFFQGVEEGNIASIQQLNRIIPLINFLAQHSLLDEDDDLARAKLISAYKYAITQLPHIAYFGLDLPSRLRVLARADTLAENGAMWAVSFRRPDVAVEMLEQGRAVFWLQYLGLRKAFDGLPKDLTSRLREIAVALERASQQSSSGNDSVGSRAARENMAIRLRHMSEEFEGLVEQARVYPGFEHFLLPLPFQALAPAAEQGPVIVLIATPFACFAVVVLCQPEIAFHQFHLKNIDMQDLVSMVSLVHEGTRRGRTSMRDRATKVSASKKNRGTRPMEDVLAYLWTNIFSILNTVLKVERATGTNRPRWTVCPTGVFARLPIHAAGVYTGPKADQIGLNNFAVISYTPTFGALLSAQKRPSLNRMSDTTMILASVSQPKGGWTHLPSASQEIEEIRHVLPRDLDQCVLSDNPGVGKQRPTAPTTGALLEILPTANLVHLACHGHQDKNNALSSGFVLQDGMLTVAQLMSMRLHQPQLAFLSACETAKGDDAQPNQAIHLAATMMFVGFPSVIGTLWSMDDVDGPEVAITVYKELFQPGSDVFDRSKVPYALDAAIQKLRIRGLSASRWAPYVHFGA